MAMYRVTLTVEMEAHSPENAVEMIADMADGWTYTARNMNDNVDTIVHLEYGKPTESYPTRRDLSHSPLVSLDAMESMVSDILPKASFEVDNYGQIVIYTNLTEIEDGVVQDIDEIEELLRSDL